MRTREPANVLIGDDEALFREAVRAVLDAEPDLSVVADLGHGGDVLEEARRSRPDVALLRADLFGCDTIELTRQLVKEGSCHVLLLMGRGDPGVLLEALKAGANGCVTMDTPLGTFVDSVRLARRGEILVPPQMLKEIIDRLIHQAAVRNGSLGRVSQLTARERIVLRLLSEGGSNESIARALYISPQTVRTHIQNLLSKLDMHTRLEAAMFVAQTGILDELADSDVLSAQASRAPTLGKGRGTAQLASVLSLQR